MVARRSGTNTRQGKRQGQAAKQPDPPLWECNSGITKMHPHGTGSARFLRTLATPEPIKDWSLTSLKEKLIKIGAKVISHGRSIAFQMAEVAIPRQMFKEILRLIAELRPKPPPAPA